MKILGIHADPCHLGGHTRLFLMMMDIFKSLGYDIHIVSRTRKKSTGHIKVPILDPVKGKPLISDVDVTASMDLSHHKINDILKYQPLRHVKPKDVSEHDIPVVYWGDHFLTPWAPEVIAKIEEADYIFVDTEMYVRMESDLDIAEKHIQFVHFPTENIMPVYTKEPRHLWANSVFTQSWIRIRWGFSNPNYIKMDEKFATYNIPRQVFEAQVVNPPLYIEDYTNDFGFSDRRYDVVMFARLGEDKFTVANFLDKNFRLLSIGALSPLKTPRSQTPLQKGVKRVDLNAPKPLPNRPRFIPKGTLHKNVTFEQAKQLLRTAKVYVHGKGFGFLESGGVSEPEHFGITICEAMASGCPIIVPKTGGCWTDIALMGKYGLGYSSLEELKFHVKRLTKDRAEWEKWHNLALEGVQRFDTENTKNRINELLG